MQVRLGRLRVRRYIFFVDRPAVQPHKLLDQGQTDTRTLVSPALGSFKAMETIENPRQFMGRNANSGVLDGEHGRSKIKTP
jgi:hypothetical protein